MVVAFQNSLYIYANLKTVEVIQNRQMRFCAFFSNYSHIHYLFNVIFFLQ